MQERFPTVYAPASLAEYTFKDRLMIRLAAAAFHFLIKLIGSTLRFEIEGEDPRAELSSLNKVPIFAIWHDRIFASTYFMRNDGIVVLTSKSFDGEYIARFLTKFGFGSIRGSSSRGGVRGLVEMIRFMKAGLPMAFTVDGPRGPRYEVKSGPILLAKKTGNPILPFVIECRKYWQVKSWDRLQIPKPFSLARVFFAEPVSVDADIDDDGIELKREELQRKLLELNGRGESWRRG